MCFVCSWIHGWEGEFCLELAFLYAFPCPLLSLYFFLLQGTYTFCSRAGYASLRFAAKSPSSAVQYRACLDVSRVQARRRAHLHLHLHLHFRASEFASQHGMLWGCDVGARSSQSSRHNCAPNVQKGKKPKVISYALLRQSVTALLTSF